MSTKKPTIASHSGVPNHSAPTSRATLPPPLRQPHGDQSLGRDRGAIRAASNVAAISPTAFAAKSTE